MGAWTAAVSTGLGRLGFCPSCRTVHLTGKPCRGRQVTTKVGKAFDSCASDVSSTARWAICGRTRTNGNCVLLPCQRSRMAPPPPPATAVSLFFACQLARDGGEGGAEGCRCHTHGCWRSLPRRKLTGLTRMTAVLVLGSGG